jgi:hypothetical protein
VPGGGQTRESLGAPRVAYVRRTDRVPPLGARRPYARQVQMQQQEASRPNDARILIDDLLRKDSATDDDVAAELACASVSPVQMAGKKLLEHSETTEAEHETDAPEDKGKPECTASKPLKMAVRMRSSRYHRMYLKDFRMVLCSAVARADAVLHSRVFHARSRVSLPPTCLIITSPHLLFLPLPPSPSLSHPLPPCLPQQGVGPRQQANRRT